MNDWLRQNLACEITDEKFNVMEKYMELVLYANKSLNLTAITDRRDFFVKHIIDSLTLSEFVQKNCELLDVGTGAGFPGVVLKIAHDGINLTLLEAKKKKVDFLTYALGAIGVCATVIHGRSEELVHSSKRKQSVVLSTEKKITFRRDLRLLATENTEKILEDVFRREYMPNSKMHLPIGKSSEKAPLHPHQFDVVTARAVGRLDKLVKSCFPLVNAGGVLLAMKGPDVCAELDEAQGVIKRLGGLVQDVRKLNLPGGDGRTIVVIRRC